MEIEIKKAKQNLISAFLSKTTKKLTDNESNILELLIKDKDLQLVLKKAKEDK